MTDLKGKVAVITGGNSGIGYATAYELIASGAQVVITGRDKELLDKAAEELGAIGIIADQSKLDQVNRLALSVKERFGKIDIIFLNAGRGGFEPVETATEEHYDTLMDLNVKGVYFTVQKFLPILNDNGSIIFNASVNAVLGMPNSSVYAAAKASILAISKVLAVELSPRKIRVNAISPGPVATPIYNKIGLQQDQLDGLSAAMCEKILLKRFGKPEEIAKTVKFLASDDSFFITGTEISVDGGITVNAVIY